MAELPTATSLGGQVGDTHNGYPVVAVVMDGVYVFGNRLKTVEATNVYATVDLLPDTTALPVNTEAIVEGGIHAGRYFVEAVDPSSTFKSWFKK